MAMSFEQALVSRKAELGNHKGDVAMFENYELCDESNELLLHATRRTLKLKQEIDVYSDRGKENLVMRIAAPPHWF